MNISQFLLIEHLTPCHVSILIVLQWHWPAYVFPIYKVVVAIYVVTWLYLTMLYFPHHDPYPWECYLTNWSYTLLSCHLVLSAAISVVHTAKHGNLRQRTRIVGEEELQQPIEENSNRNDAENPASVVTIQPDPLPWVMKLDWIIYSTISNIALIVTTVYFSILYPKVHHGKLPSIQDFHVHGVNTVVIIMELCFNGIPIRLGHAIYPFIYGWIYGTFSLIFWSFDHSRVVYPLILDWNHLETTIPSLLILGFVLVPLFQLVLFGLYKLKMKLYYKLHPLA
jgi:hypothetical protein